MDINKLQLEEFFNKVDNLFPIPLSEEVDIEKYCDKLLKNALIFTKVIDNKIVSLVAGYNKNTTNNLAYVTMVATLPEYQGKGYAKINLLNFIEQCKKDGLDGVNLHASEKNTPAINLYNSLGFIKTTTNNDSRPNYIHLLLHF